MFSNLKKGKFSVFGPQGTFGDTTVGGTIYDNTCVARAEAECLVNSIYLYGPKVVLVNLDDACQIEELERLGIFIQIGDLIFVTGRENACAW